MSLIRLKEPRFLESKRAAIRSVANYLRGRDIPAYPLEVMLEVSNVCNLRCAMCGVFSAINPQRYARLQSMPRKYLELGVIQRSLADVLQHAVMVQCFGLGEPTLHPQFREIISYVSSFEVLIAFVTNGMTLSAKLAEFLVEKQVFDVGISFSCSSAAEYEAIYQGGRFERVLSNMRQLAEAKRKSNSQWPQITISSVAFERHVGRLDEFVEMMADHGANRIVLNPVLVDQHTPYLAHHLAVYQPEVHDPILKRAHEVAGRRNVSLLLQPWLRHMASSEAQAQELRGKRVVPRALTSEQLAQVPRVPLLELPAMAQTVSSQPRGDHFQRYHGSIDVRSDTLATALQKMRFAHPRQSFCCTQPWSMMYVDACGRTRPCCYATLDWGLGDVTSTTGMENWRGLGFRLMQLGVLNGHYPDMCTSCIASGMPIGQMTQRVHVSEYLRWFESNFVGDLRDDISDSIWDRDRDDAQEIFAALRARMSELYDRRLPELQQALSQPAPARCAARRVLERVFRMPLPEGRTGRGQFCEGWLEDGNSCANCEVPFGSRASQVAALSSEQEVAAQRHVAEVVATHETPREGDVTCDGWLDGVSEGEAICGWLYSSDHQGLRLEFELLFDEVVVYEGRADRYREDLLWCGKGDGCHSFRIPLAQLPPIGQTRQIALRVKGTRRHARNSPQAVRVGPPR